MQGFKKVLLVCGFVCLFLVNYAYAYPPAVTLPWSTTFNFPDIYNTANNNGMYPPPKSSAYVLCGNITQVTPAANYPGGGGGNGLRFWDGDGNNSHSAFPEVFFPSPQKELWFRWYMRYQQGYVWNPLNYAKHLYVWSAAGSSSSNGAIPEFAWANNYRIYAEAPSGGTSYSGNTGWQSLFGTASDGSWHCYEIHIKMDTNQANGIAEMWLDGVNQFSVTNANFSGGNGTAAQGWLYVDIKSNQSSPSNGTCMYVDYDDIAISTTSRIGPIGSTSADKTPPAVPTSLMATAASSSQINLAWTASTDNVGVTGYYVFRGGVQIATTPNTSYHDTSLSPDTTYSYTVSAYDAAGNKSAQSTAASATTTVAKDTQPPTVPTGLAASVISATQINLSWRASTDNVGVTGYNVYRNGSPAGSSSKTSFSDTGLSPSTTYKYTVAAYDAAGNTSAQCAQVSATTPAKASTDTTPPSIPTNLTATAASSTQINLAWTASTDNVGVTGYNIYRAGTKVGSTAATSYSDTGLTPSTTYSYTVAAYDAAGNVSAQSTAASAATTASSSTLLFEEDFNDNNFTGRGWYDSTDVVVTTAQHIPGSTSSAQFHYLKGATTPTSGGAMRKLFAPTSTIYVGYHVMYSTNWVGSGVSYHPHEFMLLSTKDTDYDELSFNYLATYIEQNAGIPRIIIQDGQNINQSQINVNLLNVSENRAVAGCNGSSDSYPAGECYVGSGSTYYNGKTWNAGSVYFQPTPGPYYMNNWHFVEVYMSLNSIQNGKGVADGLIEYWYDGTLIMQEKNVMFRTGEYPNMQWTQFDIAPYIGVGSPVDQYFWIDNLKVATGR